MLAVYYIHSFAGQGKKKSSNAVSESFKNSHIQATVQEKQVCFYKYTEK